MLIVNSSGVNNELQTFDSCLFCLKKSAVRKSYRKSENNRLSVEKFNRVWKYLRSLDSEWCKEFKSVPPTCDDCGNNINQISEHLLVLEKLTTQIKNVLRDNARNERLLKFAEQLEDSGIDKATAALTLEVLHGVKQVILTEDNLSTSVEPESNLDADLAPELPEDIFSPTGSDTDGDELVQIKLEEDLENDTTMFEDNGGDGSEMFCSNGDVPQETEEDPSEPPRKRSKHTRRILICDMCRDQVPKDEMHQHVRNHVGDYALECPNPNCGFLYCTMTHLREHIFRRLTKCKSFFTNAKTQYTCDICGYQGSQQAIRNHLRVVHEGDPVKDFTCPVANCEEKFCNRQTVYFHISHRHSVPRQILLMPSTTTQKCPECFKVLLFDEVPNHLVETHEVPLESIISCKYCPYKASNRNQLIEHHLIHFRNGITVACDMCPDDAGFFSRHVDLKKHYKEKHDVGEDHICEHCNSRVTTKGSLRRHLKMFHSGDHVRSGKQKRLKCDLCPDTEEPKLYVAFTDLMSHKMKVHNADPWKCSTCEKQFTCWKPFLAHQKTHKKIVQEQFACDLDGCDRVFTYKRDLERHQSTSVKHAGKTNAFICEECGTGCNSKETLKKHVDTVHVTERKFVCETCGKSYKYKDDLRKHMLLHTDKMPYECPVCKKRFHHKQTWQYHVGTHSKVRKNAKKKKV